MQTREAMQAGRLAVLEGAILALLRDAKDDGVDGLTIAAEADEGQVSIDLAYTVRGNPVSGESL